MPKIFFNHVPKKPASFPFFKFDSELNLLDIELSLAVNDNETFRSVVLEILDQGHKHPVAEIKLYHSGNVYNFERTFDSAQILAKEIVSRFNSYIPKGQQCLELS